MATNISVSNVSPMLTYIPRTLWFEGTPENDTELSSYTYQSYHATNASQGQASVSFSWYGTGIWVYGGYRERLGPYDVVLDGEVTSFPGFISGPEQVPAILFSRSGLQPHVHQIQIINTSQDPTRPVLDFDHLLAETPADEARIVDDKAPGCSWLPSGNQTWGSDTQSHWTNDSVASVELNFTVRHGISVFGVVAAANGAFSVSIDGRLTHTLYPNTETNPLVNTSQLLFSGLNLGTGNHTILIQNNPLPSSRATLNIDYSQVLSDAPPPPPKPTSNNLVIIIACLSSMAFVLILLLFWHFCTRHRRRIRHRRERAPRPFLEFAPSASQSQETVLLITHPQPGAGSPTSPTRQLFPPSRSFVSAQPPRSSSLSYATLSSPVSASPVEPKRKQRASQAFADAFARTRRRRLPPATPPPSAALPALPPAASVAPRSGRADKVGSPTGAEASNKAPGGAKVGVAPEMLIYWSDWADDQLPPPYRLQDMH